ncbi:hypothetical protein D3C72_2049720 [compost metagenome]
MLQLTVLDEGHLVLGLGRQLPQLLGIVHGHHAHAIGAVVGLDDDERRLLDAIFLVLAAHLGQHGINIFAQLIKRMLAGVVEIHPLTAGKQRVDQPWIDAH